MSRINERRPQLSDETAGMLRDRIMSGALRPGERIRLEEVAEEAGPSITPVREALLMLRAEDMVELQPRRGYVVAPLSRQDVVDVFALQGRPQALVVPAHRDALHPVPLLRGQPGLAIQHGHRP